MTKQELLEIIEKAYKEKWTKLNLSFNDLTSLPAEIGKLQSLKELILYENKLTSLPAEIGKLQKLTFLDLQGNSLPIPPEILEKTDQPQAIT